MKLYNSLSKKVEEFKPINPPKVGLYTCGPTVYYYPQIGNWRTFVFEDVLRRVLEFSQYEVNHVMNITDVGHLTGDNIGEADLGEDRIEKAAKREGKTAWEIAEFYIQDFIRCRNDLNILPPTHFVRATDHIKDQIDLIEKLEKNDLTYTTEQGVYFDVSKFPNYGKLGGQKLVDKREATGDELKIDSDKRNSYDFALWKFSPKDENRHMEWDSPWGVGFPGWHIECSAMSMKYLGENFDIHTGGVDHIAIHHTNEMAQSEGATGKQFANYWLHGEFLKVDNGRMGKSLGNAYTLQDINEKGYESLALRYLYLTAHYRDVLNFTWESLEAAQNGLNNLRSKIATLDFNDLASIKNKKKFEDFRLQFGNLVSNDLSTPQALALTWDVSRSDLTDSEKYLLLSDFDKVLGLDLVNFDGPKIKVNIPDNVKKLAEERKKLRDQKKFDEADKIRIQIEELGFLVKDIRESFELRPR